MDVNDLLARVIVLTLFLGLSQGAGDATECDLDSSNKVTGDYSTSENLTATSNSNNEESALVLNITTSDGKKGQNQAIVNFSVDHIQRLQECVCSPCNIGCSVVLKSPNSMIPFITDLPGDRLLHITTWQCSMTLDEFNRILCFKVQDATSRCTVNKNACHVFSHLNVHCNQSYYSVSWDSSQTLKLAFVNDDFVNVTYCNDNCPGSGSTKGNPNDHEGSEESTPIIIGVALGTAATLAVVIAVCVVLYRRRKKTRKKNKLSTSQPDLCCHHSQQERPMDSSVLGPEEISSDTSCDVEENVNDKPGDEVYPYINCVE